MSGREPARERATCEASVLGRLLVMQSVVGSLPGDESIIDFVCRGLADVPGVNRVVQIGPEVSIAPPGMIFKELSSSGKTKGAIGLEIGDKSLYAPYDSYIDNFCFMIAVILEQREQKLLLDARKTSLEESVREGSARLRETTDRFRAYVENAPVGIIEWDLDFRVAAWNPAAERIFGYPEAEILGNVAAVILPEESRQKIDSVWKELVHDGMANHSTNANLTRNGDRILCDWFNAPLFSEDGKVQSVVSIVQDVTERSKMMESLQRTERLESLGILAGGIAHDFNNLLMGLFGYLNIALESRDDAEAVRSALVKALGAFDRAKALTMQLLTFSKGGQPSIKPVDIGPRLVEWVSFALSGSGVHVSYSISPGLRSCSVDEAQIAQSIDNIVINAKQALRGEGNLKVIAENETLTADNAAGLPAGQYARVTFEDDGPGIPVDRLKKIFDPFYTTKPGGSGLGLAMSHSIITRHGGAVVAFSEPGKGATFDIFLPCAPGTENALPSADVPRTEERPTEGIPNRGWALVMDDEESIRDITSAYLRNLGFGVECHDDGAKAVEAYFARMKSGEPFKLAILDLTVPGGMGGAAAMRMIRERAPGAVIIASSGYSDSGMGTEDSAAFSALLPKPYLRKDFRSCLESLGLLGD